MQKLVFIDTETTGKDVEDRLIQVAGSIVEITFNAGMIGFQTLDKFEDYFKTFVPIKIEAMAIHHITDKMLHHKENFVGSAIWNKLKSVCGEAVMVAHNANFDREMLLKENILFNKYIDTLQVFKHLFPDLPQYNLQFLRYYFGLEITGNAHDAITDVLILQNLFIMACVKAKNENYNKSSSEIIDYLIELSQKPLLLKALSFGKYKDLTFEEVQKNDRKYLSWLYSSESDKPKEDQNVNLVFTLKHWLS